MPVSNERIQKWAHIGAIVQSIVVVAALVIAFFDVYFSRQNQNEQKYEAVHDIISKSINPAYVSDAFYNLYAGREQTLKQDDQEFERSIGALHSYFWLVDSCIGLEICGMEEAFDRFCEDFKYYAGIIQTKYQLSQANLNKTLKDRGLTTLQERCLPSPRQ
jgi:hypothetical protein